MVHPIWADFPQVQEGLVKVKQVMLDQTRDLPQPIRDQVVAAIDAPGKYLRSGLVLLVALEREGHLADGRYQLAAALELFHLATLFHDDVIDGAAYRRGLPALHQTSSNRLAIYAGDYLLAKAGHLMGQGLQALGLTQAPTGLQTRAIEGVLAGEIRQLLNQHKLTMTLKDYLKQIQGKTALLFALACQAGTIVEGSRTRDLQLAYQGGRALGMAFQLADDLLDYEQNLAQAGKPQFQDVQNGIYTAPLVYAMATKPALVSWLAERRNQGWTESDLVFLLNQLEEGQALEQTRQLQLAYLNKAERALLQLGLSAQNTRKILEKI